MTLKGSDQKCLKYEGERCVEYPADSVKSFALHTPKGNLIWDDESIGLSVYGKDLPNLPVPQNVPINDSSRATIESDVRGEKSTAALRGPGTVQASLAAPLGHLPISMKP